MSEAGTATSGSRRAARPFGRPHHDLNIAIVVSRYNADVVERLLAGAVETLEGHGIGRADLTDRARAGCVGAAAGLPPAGGGGRPPRRCRAGLRDPGDTPHFEYVCTEAARGITEASRDTGVPVAFGLLTTTTAGGAAGPAARTATRAPRRRMPRSRWRA